MKRFSHTTRYREYQYRMQDYTRTQLKRLHWRIMRRVYGVYLWRQLTQPIVTYSIIIMTAFIALTRSVSLPHVIHNAQGHGEWSMLAFFVRASTHTDIVNYVFLAVILFGFYALLQQRRPAAFMERTISLS
jgi:hypothetical protein